MTVADCDFCDRTKVEGRIIAGMDNWYLVASLGQLTNGGHVLLIPKEHVPCIAALSPQRIRVGLLLAYLVARAYYVNNFTPHIDYVTIFEHGIAGQTVKHAHFQMLPKLIDFSQSIRKEFPTAEFWELQSLEELTELYQKRKEPYLFWLLALRDVITITVWFNPPVPPQYLRIKAAEFLGNPELGDWRKVDQKADRRLIQYTVDRLKPFFQ